MGILIPGDGLYFLGELGIGQSVAKGIGHLSSIVPALHTGKGSRGAAGIVEPQDLVLIAGLIVLVAHVDVLSVDQVAVAVHLLQVGELIVAEVLHRGGGKRTAGPGVRQVPRHIGRAGQDIGQADKTVVSHRAKYQTGIYAVLLLLDPFHVHSVGAVDQHHGFGKRPAVVDHSQQISLFLMEREHGYAFGIHWIQIHPFTTVPGEEDEGHIVVVVSKGRLQIIRIEIHGYLADAGGPPGSGRTTVDAAVGICLPQNGVNLKAGRFKSGIELSAPVSIEAGVAGVGLVYRVLYRVAEKGNAAFLRTQRKGVVFVAQQYRPFMHGADIVVPCVGQEPLRVLCVQLPVGRGIVIGLPAYLDVLSSR